MKSLTLFRNKFFKFILFLGILSGCWYLGRIFKVDVPYYQTLLSQYPLMLSGFIFILLYVATTTFIWFGPKDILRIASAVLFGAVVSSFLIWIGELINALIMFHLSRALGRDFVQQKMHIGNTDLDKMSDDSSLLNVVAWRINPLIPFRLMDLGYGLSKISFRKYFFGIAVITFFRILWLQYILNGIGINFFEDIEVVMQYLINNPRIIQYSGIYFLAVILVTLMAIINRFVQKKKSKKGDQSVSPCDIK